MGIKAGNVIQSKVGTVARTDTSAKTLFTLPGNAMIVRTLVYGVAGDSATSSTVTLKNVPFTTGTAATFATVDVKTAGIETTGRNGTLTGIGMNKVAESNQITATYSESGAASVGGPWTVIVEYI
jgi:hypothetical protein